MQEYEHSVFISYAWGGESEEIVDQLDRALQQRGLSESMIQQLTSTNPARAFALKAQSVT